MLTSYLDIDLHLGRKDWVGEVDAARVGISMVLKAVGLKSCRERRGRWGPWGCRRLEEGLAREPRGSGQRGGRPLRKAGAHVQQTSEVKEDHGIPTAGLSNVSSHSSLCRDPVQG